MAFYRHRNGGFAAVGSNSFYVKENGTWVVASEIKNKRTGAWDRTFINEIAAVASSTASLDVSTLFDAAVWTSTTPKRVTIGSSEVIGPMTIPANMGGTIEIDNAGQILGLGGSTGAAGGDAITNSATGVTINNTGTIAGGGGGGGNGGTGGGGYYTNSQSLGSAHNGNDGSCHVRCRSVFGSPASCASGCLGGDGLWRCTNCVRNTTVYTSGGSGGTGGIGRGYNQALTNGTSGASGGSNAGAGGAGGNGGDYGVAGDNGNSGANGNNGSGAGGSSGGAAGAAVSGTAVTMNNTGTVAGTF